MYIKAMLRQKWVTFLKTNSRQRKEFMEEEMVKLFAWITDSRYTTEELDKMIETNGNKAH
jgi:hypothetical protein